MLIVGNPLCVVNYVLPIWDHFYFSFIIFSIFSSYLIVHYIPYYFHFVSCQWGSVFVVINFILCNISFIFFQSSLVCFLTSVIHCSACYRLKYFAEFLTCFYYLCSQFFVVVECEIRRRRKTYIAIKKNPRLPHHVKKRHLKTKIYLFQDFSLKYIICKIKNLFNNFGGHSIFLSRLLTLWWRPWMAKWQ